MKTRLTTSKFEESGTSSLEKELYFQKEFYEEKRSFFQKAWDVTKGTLDLYYKPKIIEKRGKGKIYRNLGVHLFKKIVPTGGDYIHRMLKWKMPPYSLDYVIKISPNKKKGLQNYVLATYFYETLHLGLMTISMPGLIDKIQEGDIGGTLHGIGWNLAANVYPIMLQRYNRSRMRNVLDGIQERTFLKSD